MSTTTIVSNSATILQEDGRMVLTILSSNTAAGVLAEKTQQALDAIDSAADTAMFTAGMYPDTALGLAGTVDGEYFSIPSPEADEFSILYQNVTGSAVEKKRFGTAAMSQAAIDAAAVAEAAADFAFDTVQGVADVSIYNTKAEATAAVSGLPDLALVQVLADESLSGIKSLYRKESGSLVFKQELLTKAVVDAAVADAEAAQTAAETARDAAQLSAGVYADTAAGIAATTSGDYFSVLSADSAEYLILYKNNAGSAVEQKRYPAASAVSAIDTRVTALEAGEMTGSTANESAAGAAVALPATPSGYKKVIINGVAFAMPYYAWIEPVDLFIIVGQSNAEGRGDSSLSPAAPNGRYISGSTITSPLADPVGGALTGSMWPAFANEWYAQTGRVAAFVESATGGTALLPDTAGSNWSPSGSLRAAAAYAANTAITAIGTAPEYALGDVYFVWAQGEQDAVNINGTTITGPLYEAALETLAAYFKAQVPQMVTMGVVQTGGEFDLSDTVNYAAIRLAQENACTDSANLTMLYRGAHSFIARNFMADNVHYNQSGLNVAGKCAARALATGTAAIPSAPAVLAATAYPDSTYTASAGRAADHTTASGTKMLIVAVSAMRPEANTTYLLDSVTFGGVAMTRLRDEKASVNTGTPGRVNSSIWYLTETAYGSSLSGVTASLSVNDTSSINIVDWCVIDCDAEGVPAAYNFFAPTPATTADGSAIISTNSPSLVVGIGSSAASAAAPLTATLTNLTEAMDHGLTNTGATRAGQMVVGHAAESAIVTDKTYTVTWTTTCTAIAFVVGAFRGKIAGEQA